MQDRDKSKEPLLAELEDMRRQFNELASERQRGEQDLHVSKSTFESM